MLAAGVRQHAGRILVDQLDIRHERDTGMQPFEEIVRQKRVLRHRLGERRVERVDVVQALAGEDALAVEVLIGVGHRRRVRVDTGMPGVEPAKSDPAALANVTLIRGCRMPYPLVTRPSARIETRAIERVLDDPDQLTRPHPAAGAYRCRA